MNQMLHSRIFGFVGDRRFSPFLPACFEQDGPVQKLGEECSKKSVQNHVYGPPKPLMNTRCGSGPGLENKTPPPGSAGGGVRKDLVRA